MFHIPAKMLAGRNGLPLLSYADAMGSRVSRRVGMSGTSRRFGWYYTLKWVLLIVFGYFGLFLLWRHEPSENEVKPFPHSDEILLPSRVRIPQRHSNGSETKNSPNIKLPDVPIAILVFCATREAAIRNHLTQLVAQRPSAEHFPIYVSQDSNSQAVAGAVGEFVTKSKNIHHWTHNRRPPNASQRNAKNYFYIAQHYKTALDRVFAEHETVIITEDDLDIASDFFSYFSALYPLLRDDPTVWCVSAWNDNGGSALTDRERSDRLYRTDFFPGLGWMLRKEVWRELSPNWPDAYWDDWMRQPNVRKDRSCIRPEISRTSHNNKLAGKGSSNGMYKTFLESIHLPDTPIDFSLIDLTRLWKPQYDAQFIAEIKSARPLTLKSLINDSTPHLSPQFAYRVVYNNPREFRQIADKFKLMNDFRSGMPRTAYFGVVSFLSPERAKIFAVHSNFHFAEVGGPVELASAMADTSKVYDLDWDKMNRYLDFAKLYCRPGKWTGVCDPNADAMKQWFTQRRMQRRLQSWGEMIVV